MKLILPLIAVALCALGFQSKPSPPATKKSPASLTFKDVQPIFRDNCVGCHSGKHAKAGIDLKSYQGVMDGGEDGPIIKKGAPKQSLLVKALRGEKGVRKMPPGDKLADAKIAKIESWITSGAKP